MARPLLVIAGWMLLISVALPQGYPPEQAVARMATEPGFEARLIASEPLVRQPLSVTFDGKGRMWVIQYLQYPNPAGLKAVSQDQYLRTVWDKVPEPPPRGPKGADRITILEDPDATGRYQKAKDFVGGLNLATGLALGHGGAFVMQSPYLLFYPDRNGDDIPDSDPEVLLSGFGMEDSHAHANSLVWGPDGWLYGAQGSTVTGKVRGIEFQQGIWRYHPVTRAFELFSEGGGNTWGLDFDRHGQLIAGTNYGGHAMLHQMQGAYHVKGFSKHGPLHNAHAYGYFEHVPYKSFEGGHVTCGGVVYQGGAFGPARENQYIAGNLLSSVVNWHRIEPNGSTFKAGHAGTAMDAKDSWFRPIDLLVGPDAGVYVVDWYDKRATHLDPLDTWDRSNGRVYRLHIKGAPPAGVLNLASKSDLELIGLLSNPNAWWRREARRLLAERRPAAVLPELDKLLAGGDSHLALEALWAAHGIGTLSAERARVALAHPSEHVRAWAVRLLGDGGRVPEPLFASMTEILAREKSPLVLAQAAATAKRLPDAQALALLAPVLRDASVVADPYVPLLSWWAVEAVAGRSPGAVASWMSDVSAWDYPVFRATVASRLARRWMTSRTDAEAAALARAWNDAGAADPERRKQLADGIEQSLAGLALPSPPEGLKALAAEFGGSGDARLIRLAARLGDPATRSSVLSKVSDAKASLAERSALLDLAVAIDPAVAAPVARDWIKGPDAAARKAALGALARLAGSDWSADLLAGYKGMAAGEKTSARSLLISRAETAAALAKAIDAGSVPASDLGVEEARKMAQLKDKDLTAWVEKRFGRLSSTPGEKQARISYINLVVNRHGKGDPKRGQEIFRKQCSNCHQFGGEGKKLGPDLTTADRSNLMHLIGNIVDPSASIRPEYQSQVIETSEGRLLTGVVVEANANAVIVADSKNERVTVPRSRIETINASPQSLMPEKLLDGLPDEDLAHFFAFLRGTPPGR